MSVGAVILPAMSWGPAFSSQWRNQGEDFQKYGGSKRTHDMKIVWAVRSGCAILVGLSCPSVFPHSGRMMISCRLCLDSP